MKKFVVLVSVLLSSLQLSAQSDSARDRYGLFGAGLLNYHDFKFRQLPQVNYYSPYLSGSESYSYAAGFFYETPLSRNKKFFIKPGLSYSLHKGIFSKEEAAELAIDGQVYDGIVKYALNTEFHVLRFEPMVRIEFFKKLSLNIGMNIAYTAAATFERFEELAEPKELNFENGTKRRFESSGDIKEHNKFQSGFMAGLSYDFALGKDGVFIVSPEIMGNYNFTPNFEIIEWTTHFVRAGIALKYSPKKDEIIEEIVEKSIIDTVVMNKPGISSDYFSAGKIRKQSSEAKEGKRRITTFTSYRTDTLFIAGKAQCEIDIASDKIQVEEYISTEMYPLLNYIFFEKGSSELKRYNLVKSQADFDQSKITGCIEAYRNILNIIGKRLNESSGAELIIKIFMQIEPQISTERAAFIKAYLTDIWKIRADRIAIVEEVYPENPSNSNTAMGEEENRRIELESNDAKILAPVLLENKLKKKYSPENINLNIKCDREIKSINAVISSENRQKTAELTGGSLPLYSYLDEFLTDEQGEISLNINVHAGNNEINFEKKLKYDFVKLNEADAGGKRIDSYRLLLFDFDKSSLRKEHYGIIDLIKKNLQKYYKNEAFAAKIKITGYTDISGSDGYNQTLSEARAKETYKALGINSATYIGAGEKELYDNSTPEGRYYSRTVEIIVETE